MQQQPQPLITPPQGPAAGPAPAPGAPPPGDSPGAPAAAPGQGPGGQVDPRRQQQYDVLVSNAIEFIHGPQLEQVLARLSQGDPAEAAGLIAGEIMAGQVMSATAAGVDLDRGALFHGTNEVVGAVLEVAGAAGLIEQPPPDNDVNFAFVAALDKVVDAAQQSGMVSEQEIAQARQMSEQLRATPQGQEAFAAAGGAGGVQGPSAPGRPGPAPAARAVQDPSAAPAGPRPLVGGMRP